MLSLLTKGFTNFGKNKKDGFCGELDGLEIRLRNKKFIAWKNL